jgi:hypothetical protein
MQRRLLVALAVLLSQGAAAAPRFVEDASMPVTAQEAFAGRYGQAIVDALGKALNKNADPACLAAKRIAREQLRGLGEAMLVRQGQARIDRMMTLVDPAKADAEFVRLGGPGAHDEWRTLLADPAIVEYNRLWRPARLVGLVDGTAENFGRYVLLRRIKLDEFNPLATGDSALLELSEAIEDEAVEAAEAHRKTNDTPAMQRFHQMSEWVAEALQAAADQNELLSYGPTQWMVGLDEDLRALCIGTK